jgi:hypothetical protein
MITNIFQLAAKRAIRFQDSEATSLTTESLYRISMQRLDGICVALNKQIEETKNGVQSFLTVASQTDSLTELKMQVALAVLRERQDEIEAGKKATETAQQKQKLLSLLEEKQNANMASLSEEELLAKLAQLG